MLGMPLRGYEDCQTHKGYIGESRGDNADSTDRGGTFEAVRPKLIRARSRFEGVEVCPETKGLGVYGRKLRSNYKR